MYRRILYFLISILLCVSLFSFSVFASTNANGGFDINYWYSDSNSAGTWTSTYFPIYVSTTSSSSSLSVSNLKSYLDTAVTSWNCVDFGYYTTNTSISAKIMLQGITRSDATILQIPTDVVGATSYTKDYVGSLYYGTSTKNHYVISDSHICLVESDATSTISGAKKSLCMK